MDIEIIGTSNTPLSNQFNQDYPPELQSAIMEYLDKEDDDEEEEDLNANEIGKLIESSVASPSGF